jgi:hypothetical protein
MLSTVIIFALVTAALEFILLMKWAPSWLLRKKWFAASIHVIAFGGNMLIHWGTIVGTMTAVVACLASFVTFPAAKWMKTLWENYRQVTVEC